MGGVARGKLVAIRTYDYKNGLIIELSPDAKILLHPEDGVTLMATYIDGDSGDKKWGRFTGSVQKFIDKVKFRATGA